MWSLVDRLQAPELVIRVQEFFGIKYLTLDDQANDRYLQEASPSDDRTGRTLHKRNISNVSSETDEGFVENSGGGSSSSGDNRYKSQIDDDKDVANRDAIKPYEVTNWFWYYLFVIGTELGDEIFYASMLPFWFWNVDGAVGRRVVFVWSIIMYIGKYFRF